MQSLFSGTTINNEIELCAVSPEWKSVIERAFSKNHLSYFIRWRKSSVFGRRREVCIICVNDYAKEEARALIQSACGEQEDYIRFL